MATPGDLANEIIGDDSSNTGGESNIRIKINIKEASAKLAKKLNEEISRGHADTAFLIVLIFTIIKDLGGLVPIFGDTLALVITGALYIFMMGKGWFLKTRLKVIFWVFNGIIAFIPAIDLVLVVTNPAVTIYAWYLVKKRMRKAEKKLSILGQLTLSEMEELNNNIELLDNEDDEFVYTSQGTLSIRSQKIIREAKKIIRENDNQERPAQKTAINDGVKRAESFRRNRQIKKISEETMPDGTKKLNKEQIDKLRDPEAREYSLSKPIGSYVEFDQKSGRLIPTQTEREDSEDWPIAI